MSLIVLTGPVRSGKSGMAERLASERGGPVVCAVAGWTGDGEMERRVAAHRASRPDGWSTLEARLDPAWLADVPRDAVLLLDCLGSVIANACFEVVGDAPVAGAAAESAVARAVDGFLAVLLGRAGDTVVVTNETGWGVVPKWASARIFRDELGRANRRLVEAADAAYLVVDGRCVDLSVLPMGPQWPTDDAKEAK
jgi:adenosylcobinamide kinase/adenosylcobinamide-phosphate guanylyltransferase